MELQWLPMHHNWKVQAFEGSMYAFDKPFPTKETTGQEREHGKKDFYKYLSLITHGHEKKSFYENLLVRHRQQHILKHTCEHYIQAMTTYKAALGHLLYSEPRESVLKESHEALESFAFLLKLSKKLISQRERFSERVKRLVKEIDEEALAEISNLGELDANSLKRKVDELIRVSLDSADLKKARKVLRFAISLFPDHEYYRNCRKLIAPPKIVKMKESGRRGIANTIAFLKKSGKQFTNKWIAVSDGVLLGVSDSYGELFEQYRGQDVIITRVV